MTLLHGLITQVRERKGRGDMISIMMHEIGASYMMTFDTDSRNFFFFFFFFTIGPELGCMVFVYP